MSALQGLEVDCRVLEFDNVKGLLLGCEPELIKKTEPGLIHDFERINRKEYLYDDHRLSRYKADFLACFLNSSSWRSSGA